MNFKTKNQLKKYWWLIVAVLAGGGYFAYTKGWLSFLQKKKIAEPIIYKSQGGDSAPIQVVKPQVPVQDRPNYLYTPDSTKGAGKTGLTGPVTYKPLVKPLILPPTVRTVPVVKPIKRMAPVMPGLSQNRTKPTFNNETR